MRTTTLLTTLLIAAMLAMSGVALAGSHDEKADKAKDKDKSDEAKAAKKARHDELKAARHGAKQSYHENRTDALTEYRAAHHATKASFLENKTAVIEACRAQAEAARNATGNMSEAQKHCVRDGLKPLIEQARDEHKAQKEALKERLETLRKAAHESFGKARKNADARHGRPADA